MQQKMFICVSFLMLFIVGCAHTGKDYKITILHTNDVHARLLPIDDLDQTCDPKTTDLAKCYGGVARRATMIKEMRAAYPNVLLLDDGDQFQGTLFYSKYRGQEASIFMNLMGYDAMAVGNHEFDGGPKTLADFIRTTEFPVLSANIDASRDPHLAGLIEPYTIIERGGERIGVFGVTTQETQHISAPGDFVQFSPQEEAAQKVVDTLRALGVTKIIALSHSGLERDMRIATAVDGIDVLIGGHTNHYLSNVSPDAIGPYPIVVQSKSGKPILILCAYAYGKYLGRLTVDFDAKGVPRHWEGEPILLDGKVAPDEAISKKVEELEQPLRALNEEIVGNIASELGNPKSICRVEECALGNATADAFLEIGKAYGVEIAVMNGGGLRSGISPGMVTLGQVLEAFPFPNPAVIFQMKGKDIWAMLEHGVSEAHNPIDEDTGRFLQVSNMRFTWNVTKPVGSRIESVDVKTASGKFVPLDLNRSYGVSANRFLLDGGDEFKIIKEKATKVEMLSETIYEVMVRYLKAHPGLKVGLENRITKNNNPYY